MSSHAFAQSYFIDVKVFKPDTEELLYQGGETVEKKNDIVSKVTRYRSLNGELVQEETVRYRSSDVALLDYTFDNKESGELIRLTSNNGKMSVEHREATGKETQKFSHEWQPGYAFGKMLVRYMLRHWQELKDHKTLNVKLFVPSKNDSYNFRIFPAKSKLPGQFVINMEPDKWIVRQFVPLMEFFYDEKPHSLTMEPVVSKFMGPSPVDSGPYKGKKARVEFTYVAAPPKADW